MTDPKAALRKGCEPYLRAKWEKDRGFPVTDTPSMHHPLLPDPSPSPGRIRSVRRFRSGLLFIQNDYQRLVAFF